MKSIIKEEMLNKRNSLSLEFIDLYSSSIVNKIQSLEIYKSSKKIGLFYPLKGEINLLSLLKDKKDFYFPKTIKEEMIFLLNNNSFTKGSFNVMVPNTTEEIQKCDLDIIIVPMIAYDKDNYRIGYGKGYYDRYLRDFRGYKLGVAFPFMYVEDTYHDPWDIKLDEVIIL